MIFLLDFPYTMKGNQKLILDICEHKSLKIGGTEDM